MNDSSAEVARAKDEPPRAGVLQVRGVTVRFGGLTALDGVSLDVAPRQVAGVIGPNGAGKTTLLNVLCGFVRPQSGSLSFDGRPLNRLRPHRLAALGIARTLQGVALFSHLSVLENVMTGATIHAHAGFTSALLGLPRSDRDERALAERALDALSEFGELIRRLAARASVVVVEHHMDLMMSVCDAIVVLDFGRVIATGTPDQVRSDEAVTAAYLGVEAVADPDGAGGAGGADGAGRAPGADGGDRDG